MNSIISNIITIENMKSGVSIVELEISRFFKNWSVSMVFPEFWWRLNYCIHIPVENVEIYMNIQEFSKSPKFCSEFLSGELGSLFFVRNTSVLYGK